MQFIKEFIKRKENEIISKSNKLLLRCLRLFAEDALIQAKQSAEDRSKAASARQIGQKHLKAAQLLSWPNVSAALLLLAGGVTNAVTAAISDPHFCPSSNATASFPRDPKQDLYTPEICAFAATLIGCVMLWCNRKKPQRPNDLPV